jgi:hypothetical protein
MTKGPLELVRQVAAILEALDIPYAVGGSMASSLIGEPRSTVDVDIAVRLDREAAATFLDRATVEFHVPLESARAAIASHSSFNLVDTAHGLKVDVFVLGDGLLDRMQIERRVRVSISGIAEPIWVTSPEDQVLRKLDWYRHGGHESERQWRDVVAILRVRGDVLDRGYLEDVAGRVELSALLADALRAAE